MKIKYANKLALIFFVTICIMLLVLLGLLNYVEADVPEEIIYPKSGLSESLFVSQNMKYTPDEKLTKEHHFSLVPYMFDVPEVDAAKVDTGSLYGISDGLYLYATEYAKDKPIDIIMREQLSKVVLIDFDKNLSSIENLVLEKGYVNGFKAEYRIDCITTSNGEEYKNAYILGYNLLLEEFDYNMYVGIATLNESTELYKLSKQWVDVILGTYQFDEALDEKMKRAEREALEKENKIKEQEKEEVDKQQELIDKYDTSSKFKEMLVPINEAYDSATLYFYWTNDKMPLDLTLYNPDKSASYKPTMNKDGEARFDIRKAEVGKWVLSISGDYGECSMKIEAKESLNSVSSN